jgi:hypothetical protein
MAASYVGTVKTVGETMARSVTNAHAFKIFMDEPEEFGGKSRHQAP